MVIAVHACAELVMSTIMLLYGRQGMSEHRIVVGRGALSSPQTRCWGANRQDEVLVEARIGCWVIVYRRRYGRHKES